jgi:hypothetical protein
MTLISLGIVVAFAASLTSSLGFSKLTSGGGERAVSASFQTLTLLTMVQLRSLARSTFNG